MSAVTVSKEPQKQILESQKKIDLAFSVANKMILDMEKKKQEAILSENWRRAAELDSYISGMQQILIVFEQGVK